MPHNSSDVLELLLRGQEKGKQGDIKYSATNLNMSLDFLQTRHTVMFFIWLRHDSRGISANYDVLQTTINECNLQTHTNNTSVKYLDDEVSSWLCNQKR